MNESKATSNKSVSDRLSDAIEEKAAKDRANQLHEAAQEPADFMEHLKALKHMVAYELKCSMVTHDIQDLQYKLNARIQKLEDSILAELKSLRGDK